MIPIRLDIEGLYSYKEKQTIHFDLLTAAGLFGIFGAVGSGKSSILEAILLALYGSGERLPDRGEKTSLLNLQSSNLDLRLEFKAGRSNTQEFVAIYKVKRLKNNPEQVGSAVHQFYRKSDGNLVPIEEKAPELLGMKKEHFKQTVIIPQGKFREFIDLTPGPRAEMMKELFGLGRFDLSSKTSLLLRACKDEKIIISTQIEGLGEVEKGTIEELMGQLKEKQSLKEKLRKDLIRDEKDFKKAEGLWTKYQEREKLSMELNKLNKQKPSIEEKKVKLKHFIKAKTLLKPILDSIQEKKLEKEKLSVEVDSCERFKVNYEKQVTNRLEEVEQLQKKADKRHLREAKIKDLEKVLEIQSLMAQLDKVDGKLGTLKPSIEKLLETRSSLLHSIDTFEQELEDLEEVDPSNLADLQGKLKEWEALQAKETSQEKEITHCKSQLENEQQILEQLIQKLSKPSIEEEINDATLERNYLEKAWEDWVTKKGLMNHAHLVVEGAPCPLCGSLEHPLPLSPEQPEKEESLKNNLQSIRLKLENLQKLESEIQTQRLILENHRATLKKELLQLENIHVERKNLRDVLAQDGILDKDMLIERITKSNQSAANSRNLGNSLKKARLHIREVESELEAKQQEKQGHENHKSSINSTIGAKQDEIVDMEFCHPYFEKNSEVIKSEIDRVKGDIQATAENLISKRRVLDDLRHKSSSNAANLENYRHRLKECEETLVSLQENLKSGLLKNGFESEDALLALFKEPLELDKVEGEIRSFEDEYLLLSSQLNNLESNEELVGFSEAKYREALEKFDASKTALEGQDREITLLMKKVGDEQEKLQKKQELQKDLDRVDRRLSVLTDLQKIFSGNGFVKYVSTIYLKELCATANERFLRLSKNQLSLDIDDNNTFWIIDYLNGGKKRLLRTLSGGQTFQASLCLALALAEKVKTLNQADQSFFFLDEGFGALDKNSLRVVFETLKSLRHENRVVGIISHVEELQQEIGVYANVTLDPEKGSQVSYSF